MVSLSTFLAFLYESDPLFSCLRLYTINFFTNSQDDILKMMMLDKNCDSYQLPRHVTLNAVKSL
jgi:hypothetical protein